MSEPVLHRAPEPGVTEIRVHGVGGASPESMLGQTGVIQVSGDDTAGMFRGVARPAHNVEAYAWGGLTAGSRSRALWVLLLPFALINLAGWMIERSSDSAHGGGLQLFQKVMVHITSITLTALTVMWTALATMNVLAFQCGAIAACSESKWYASFLREPFFIDRPGRRVVTAALAPLGLIALYIIVTLISRSRYEHFDDDSRTAKKVLETSLGHPGFWETDLWVARLLRVHVAGSLVVLAGVTFLAVGRFRSEPVGAQAPSWLSLSSWGALLAGAGVAATVAAVLMMVMSEQSTDKTTKHRIDFVTRLLFRGAMVLMALSLVFAWQIRVTDGDLYRNGIATDLWGFGLTAILLALVAVFSVSLFAVVEIARWIQKGEMRVFQFFNVVVAVMIVFWPQALIAAGAVTLLAAVAYLKDRRVENPLSTPRDWLIAMGLVYLFPLVHWSAGRLGIGFPWSDGWPRLTPIVLGLVILTALWLIRLNRVEGRAGNDWFPLAIPGLVLIAGVVAAQTSDRVEWWWGAMFIALTIAMVAQVASQPHEGFRWAGPGVIALFAVLLVVGASSGLMIRFVRLLEGVDQGYRLRSIQIYDWFTTGFVLLSLAGVVALVVWLLFIRRTAGSDALAEALTQVGEQPRLRGRVGESLAGQVRKWVTVSQGIGGADAFFTVTSLLMLGAVIALIWEYFDLGLSFGQALNLPIGDDWRGVASFASAATVLIGVAAVFAVRSGLRDRGFRRQFGTIWDVAGFWPRQFHPFAPPSYSSRSVPEVQARIGEIVNQPGGGGVVLSGHSQGSVVAFAAIASMPAEQAEWVRLVTHGSPLRRFYRRFFPMHFNDQIFTDVGKKLGPDPEDVADGSWLNFHRPTDFIGLAVFEQPPPPVQLLGGLGPILERAVDRGLNRPDVLLADPASLVWEPNRRPPIVLWHIAYMNDPIVSEAVAALVADLESRGKAKDEEGGVGPSPG